MSFTKYALYFLVAGFSIGCADDGVDGDQNDNSDEGDSVLIDRIGRPEMTNFSFGTIGSFPTRAISETDPDREALIANLGNERITYNDADGFALTPDQRLLFANYFDFGISHYDALDGVTQLSEVSMDRVILLDWMVDDFLIVDASKPCSVTTESYLDVEIALFRGLDHTTCGGRTPDDDFVDRWLSLLVSGFDQQLFGLDTLSFSDGLDVPNDPASNEWPYFADPIL